jgi:glycosyltransferase involved in cell wall biosynthesis
MHQEISVTIIVPVFNAEPYLEKCLTSLQKQALGSIEILIYNDCSTDRSLQICDEFASNDSRFKVFTNQAQQGQAYCLNLGISNATGEYIGTVDADDWVDIDFFQKLYRKAKEENADIAKGIIKQCLPNRKEKALHQTNKIIAKGLRQNKPIYQMFNSEVTSAIYRKNILTDNAIRFPLIPNGLDIVFLLRVGIHAKKITFCNVKYNYLILNNSISKSYSKNYFNSILDCFRLHVDFCSINNLKDDKYDYVFLKGLIGAARRYAVMQNSEINQELRENYTQNILDKLKEYNGDRARLLELLCLGMIRQQRMTKILSWWPVRMVLKILK